MSEDLIKRSDAIDAAGDQSYIAYEIRKKIRMIPSANTPYKVLAHIDLDPDEVVERMKNLQIEVNPAEGKWIRDRYWSRGTGMGEEYGFFYKCSLCEYEVENGYTRCGFNFCPYCGAKMVK